MIVVNARFLTQRLTGVQRFAYELSIRLKRIIGNEIVFVAPKNILQKDMADNLDAIIIGKMKGYIWEQIELPLWLRCHESPILINFCSVAPLFYNNCYTAVHDVTFIRYPETYSWKFNVVYNFLTPRLCRKAKKIITVSEFSKKEIASSFGISEDKFEVIYNAASDNFRPHTKDKVEKYFLAVSSVKANKNFIAALQAFEIAQKELKDIKLYVIGDCQDKNFRQININRYFGNTSIKFLGRVSDNDLIHYYNNAIGFLFPSYYEGFGIPVIEAQSCGCPVISANTSSLPEVLQNSALLFAPNDIQNFSFLMTEIVNNNDLRESLIKKGFENVKRFSWDASAKKLVDMIFEK